MESKFTKEKLVYVIMFLLSVICILIGIWYDGTSVGDIVLNVGLSILSTVIVYFLLNMSDDPMKPIIDRVDSISTELSQTVDLLKDVSETGVMRVWNTRSDFPVKEWIKRIRNANGDIRIFCYAMAFLIDDNEFDKAIEMKLKEGKRVHILLGKPDGLCIVNRTAEEQSEGNIAERIGRASQRLQKINKNAGVADNQLQIRFHDTPLYASIYIFGDTMIVTPQLYGQRGALAPIIELKKAANEDCLYNKYDHMFREIWDEHSEEIQ